MAFQTSFIPVKILNQDPFSDGKDLKLVGYAVNEIKYAIKRESDMPALPLAEWIGYRLCELCDILTPEYAIVECVDGEIAFGSRWEYDTRQINSSSSNLDRLAFVRDNASEISRVHAFDIFYGNQDRHARNFMVTQRASGPSLLAFDFSQAGPAIKIPFGQYPLSRDCQTLKLIDNIVKGHLNKFDNRKYNDCVSRIKQITKNQFVKILDSAPSNWFQSVEKSELLNWWDNEFTLRVAAL